MARAGSVTALLAAAVVLLSVGGAPAPPAQAAAGSGKPPAVFVSGKEVSFPVPPVAAGGGTLVPVRALVDSLGGHLAAPLPDVAKGLGLMEIAYREDGWHLDDVNRRAALRVRSVPPGAWVQVGEGGASCLSPCTVGDLETGSHFVRVEAAGHEQWAGEVAVKPGLNGLAVTLVRGRRGRLTVLSEPPGDRVRLDGAEAGGTPLVNLPVGPGFHRVRVEGDGRYWEGTVRVLPADPSGGMVAGDLTTVAVNLAEGWAAVGYPAGWERASMRVFGDRGSLAGWSPDGRSVAQVRSYRRKDGTSEYTTAGYFADVGLVAPGGAVWRPLTEAAEGAYFEPLGFVLAGGGAGGSAPPGALIPYRLR